MQIVSPESRIWNFMQIVSGVNLHEMSNPVLWEKDHQFDICLISQ